MTESAPAKSPSPSDQKTYQSLFEQYGNAMQSMSDCLRGSTIAKWMGATIAHDVLGVCSTESADLNKKGNALETFISRGNAPKP